MVIESNLVPSLDKLQTLKKETEIVITHMIVFDYSIITKQSVFTQSNLQLKQHEQGLVDFQQPWTCPLPLQVLVEPCGTWPS